MIMTKSDEIEVYREIMVLEQSYYHVLATRKVGYYPKIKYYAPINKIKYIGEFVGCRQGGGGDGSWYYGLYKKDNIITEISFDYEGLTCFLKTKCHEKEEVKQLFIYKSLTIVFQKVFQNKYLNMLIQSYLL